MNIIVKRILLSVGYFIVGILFLLLLVWLFPQTIITTKTVKWLADKQTAIQFDPEFPKDFDIDVRNSKLFKQKVSVQASGFCMETKDKSFKACFNQLNIKTTLNFKKFSLMFDSLGPVSIDATTIEFVSTEKKEPQKTKSKKDSGSSLPSVSEDFSLEQIQIALPQILVQSGELNIKSSVKIDGTSPGEDTPYHLVIDINAESNKEPEKMELDLTADIDREYNLQGNLKVNVGSGEKKPSVNLETSLKGNIVKAQGEIMGTIKAIYATPSVPMIEIQKFHLIKSDKLTAEGDFNINFLLGSLNNPKKSALPPPKFKTILSGKIKAEQSAQEPIQFDINIPSTEQYGMTIEAKTKGEYNTKTALLDLETFLFSFKINEFKKTVRGLKNTQMAIPAPINEMNGSISLSVGEEKIKKSGNGNFELPIEFKTNLSSNNQSLITDTSGSAKIQTSPFKGHLEINTELSDIALQMPEFDPVSKMPNVVGDKRFVKSKEIKTDREIYLEVEKDDDKPKEPSAFTTEIKITTPKKPIRIYYKLFKPAAIFRVTTTTTPEKSSFLVKFEPFEVSYMKRTAKLERLNISNDEKTKDVLMDGRFSIKKADYMLYADIHQENKKTYIELSAEPPLSEDDIISLILFNELASELDSGSTDSVENTQSAMTKKSIGFFSFFVLASTPVESVNYDPATNQYSARVKLPGGFTGTVGSDWDKAQEVGLRRRLGGKWVISAGVGTDAEGESRQESMIEWFHRY